MCGPPSKNIPRCFTKSLANLLLQPGLQLFRMRFDEFLGRRRVVVRAVALVLDGLDVGESQLEMLEEHVRPREFGCKLLRRECMNLFFTTQRPLGVLEVAHLPFLEEPVRA